MAMSKDRVKFLLSGYYFEYDAKIRPVLAEAFGLNSEQHYILRTQARERGSVEILCRPSQFARFLILREAAGFQNMFKELKAELVPAPPPVLQPIDVSGNPSRSERVCPIQN